MLDAYNILLEYGEKEGSPEMGYPSDKPCCLCQGHYQNQTEPRFNYTVCIKHQHVPPTILSRAGLV
jgi:hypothetical protein